MPVDPAADLRALILRDLRAALPPSLRGKVVVVRITDRCREAHVYTFTPDELRTPAPDTCPPARDDAPAAMKADALEAADATWRTSRELAARAGWSYSGRWRAVVRQLLDAGALERDGRTLRLRRGQPQGNPAE